VGTEGKRDSRKKQEGGVLTVWSVRGGRTIILSMVFITTRQSSFRTRFRTVFSHTVAKSVRLQAQATGEVGQESGGLLLSFPKRLLCLMASALFIPTG
jgi:hypothetical protein